MPPAPLARRGSVVLPLALLAAACDGRGTVREGGARVAVAGGEVAQPAPLDRRAATRLVVGPRFEDRALREASGLVVSERVPGLYWTMRDSGGEPELLAVTADGALLARVRVAGARNVDWEALALGPCPGERPPARGCLYVGDVGDNDESRDADRRRAPTLYRVREPVGTLDGPLPRDRRRAAAALPERTERAVALPVRLPDGPRDVEALAVLPDGAAWLVTKHRQARPDGGSRPALVYQVDADAWAGAAARDDVPRVAAARLVDSLPVVPDGSVFTRVTDAALDPARLLLAVRTYRAVYVVPLAGPPWRVDRARRATTCDVAALGEPQGEGLGILPGPAVTMLLASESNVLGPGGLATVACPPPR